MLSWSDLAKRLQARKEVVRKRPIPAKATLQRVFREALHETGDPLAAYDTLVRWAGSQIMPGGTLEEQLTAGHALLHAASYVPEGYTPPPIANF